MTSPPANEPEPSYEVKVDGNSILVKKQGKSTSSPQIELTLIEKDKVDGTDIMSFRFGNQNNQVKDRYTATTRLYRRSVCLFRYRWCIC